MSQDFLLSALGRTMGLVHTTDDEARDASRRIRWDNHNGELFYPSCASLTSTRWRKPCRGRSAAVVAAPFMPGTVFHSSTLSVRDYLAMIAVFPRPRKGCVRLTDEARRRRQSEGRPFVPLHKARDPTVVPTASSCANGLKRVRRDQVDPAVMPFLRRQRHPRRANS
jgi:hypothetical protein